MSRSRSRFLFLYLPTIGVLLLFAIYTWLWHMGAREMEKAVVNWVADQRDAGMGVEHGTVTSEGYPFLLRTHIESVKLRHPVIGAWQSEHLYIDALPYDLTRIIFSPKGLQKISLDTVEAPYNHWEGSAQDLRVSIGSDKKTGWKFIIQLEALQARAGSSLEAIVSAHPLDITVNSLLLNIAPAPSAQNDASLSTIGIGLVVRDTDVNRLGRGESRKGQLGLIEFSADISRIDALTEAPEGSEAIAYWAEQGGALIINRAALQDNPAEFLASGILSVDPAGYPAGDLATKLVKPGNFIASLGQLGLVEADQKDALTASVALAGFANGGIITTQFTLQDGRVLANGVEAGTLPRLAK